MKARNYLSVDGLFKLACREFQKTEAQMRTILDAVAPEQLHTPFKIVFKQLQNCAGTILVSPYCERRLACQRPHIRELKYYYLRFTLGVKPIIRYQQF